MTRNLDRRIEVAVPVEDLELSLRVQEALDACLADDQLAWELDSSGAWHRAPRTRGVDAQQRLLELAHERAARIRTLSR